ncbi:MAG: hypothetical protein IKK10_00930 [Clostridia bacterium]|nr:hypothetical protein [Clostridia bacterium]
MKTDSIIKAIVNAVKSKEELSGVACVYSRNRNAAENPVCSFTLCIGIGKSEYNSQYSNSTFGFTTEVKLCLLAPTGAGGKRLSEMSQWVAEAINESLRISRIEISEPRYLDTSGTLFTDIVIKVEDVNVTDAGCQLYVDDALFNGLVSFEVASTAAVEKKPELLNGYRISDTGKTDFNIKLKTKMFLKIHGSSELKFDFGNFTEVYCGCCVSKLNRVQTQSGEVTFIYDITAESMTFFEKEVQDEY